MDSMNELDRELTRALQVQPAGDFTARVRTRIANQAPASRWTMSRMALAVAGGVLIAVLAINLAWTPSQPGARPLSHQDLAMIVPLISAARSESPVVRDRAPQPPIVLVAPSEMLALQRLFAGEFVAPPESPVADELTINEVAIAPLAVPTIEGEQR